MAFKSQSYAEALEKAKARQAKAREQGKRPARIKPGKKVREWDKVRAELKQECEALGIRSCELRRARCLGSSFLSFAHSKKRRNIVGDELREACLACQQCHAEVERMPESEMGAVVRAALARRGSPEYDYPSAWT
jgi:hypothetical protein